jgi:hypothetical protein
MPKRSRKPPSDPVQAADSILAPAAGEERRIVPDGKDPAAVALGRKGGLKGGKARARALSADERKASAVKAAYARWGKAKATSSRLSTPVDKLVEKVAR